MTNNIAEWQLELSDSITQWQDLCDFLSISPEMLALSQAAQQAFPLRVPKSFLSRVEKGNPRDPLLLQVLPVQEEMLQVPGFTVDPLNEDGAKAAPGVLHKYHGRVLLTLAGSCAINCRYCFRRHFPYQDNVPGWSNWQDALMYVASDTSIQEVILSGGEPLLVKDGLLEDFVRRLECIPHLKRLRIHTRFPIVIPSRITNALVSLLSGSRLSPVLVLHSNHPNELDASVAAAVGLCLSHKIPVLNQAVLLAGVNDSVSSLVALSERLFEIGVMPYYLHLLDSVQGASHFAVSDSKAKALMEEVSERLPGYLVPKLVREISGQRAKSMVQY